MKKGIRQMRALAMSLLLALGCFVTAAKADAAGTATIQYEVTYGQTEARSMLKLVNEFRTGEDAWYWNSTDSEQVYVKRGELTYDYELERAAMQRAAEIALSFSHTRPDGTDYITVSTRIRGENIMAGSRAVSAQKAFDSWLEENKKYSGQGHRRNMLGSFTTIGIGYAECNGAGYWVMELGYSNSGLGETGANDSKTTVSTVVSTSQLSSVDSILADSVSVGIGASASLPDANAVFQFTSGFPTSKRTVVVTPDWTVTDSDIAEIRDGQLVGLQTGKTTLTAEVLGQTVTAAVTVLPALDLNGDGAVDITDVSQLLDYVTTGDTDGLKNFDLNGDGGSDISDVSLLLDLVSAG